VLFSLQTARKKLASFGAGFVVMSSVHVPSLRDWLESIILLPQYLDVFTENGYDTLQKCALLTSDDLSRIGISLPGHKKRILSQLAKFRLELECKSTEFEEFPTNCSLPDNTGVTKAPNIPVEPYMLMDVANIGAPVSNSV